MSNKQLIVALLIASMFGGLVALGGYSLVADKTDKQTIEEKQNVKFANFLDTTGYTVPEGLNFVTAAKLVTPGVVHIKSTVGVEESEQTYRRSPFDDMFRDFFGDVPDQYHQRRGPGQASGSGVIITDDGYIVTNNHVIDRASEIEVTLHDNRTFTAKLVGTDPNTDIALLKVEEEGLPFIRFGNSDAVQVGEWVLAVGNPFELTSTVTAGIVSAKGRNINILRREYGIESFIQTDAAVNPGNSGGALVDLKGQLIGINTAIATPTGSYTGYSFAVPVSLVKKVVEDLKEYGVVQRALLGVSIMNANDPSLKDEHLNELNGVYVREVNEGSAAEEAGLKKGDIIIKIDDIVVNNVAELQGQVARHRPGEKIEVTFKREGKEKVVSATLKNIVNETKLVKKSSTMTIEGGTFATVDDELKQKLELKGGVQIKELEPGKWKDAGMKEGYIITSIDKKAVEDINDFIIKMRQQGEGGVLIGGVYPDGEEAYYGVGW